MYINTPFCSFHLLKDGMFKAGNIKGNVEISKPCGDDFKYVSFFMTKFTFSSHFSRFVLMNGGLFTPSNPLDCSKILLVTIYHMQLSCNEFPT